jgi:Tfp pilus assembly protein FimT
MFLDRRSAADRRRRAMTLIEVVLTLCLLVILAGLTWPSLGRPMAAQRLREAADQIRTDWVHARVDAMSTGRTNVFRYEADSDTYSIQPQANDDESADTSQTGAEAGSVDSGGANLAAQQHRLPKKVRFAGGQTEGVSATADVSAADTSSPSSDALPAAEQNGATSPIVFRPDGTCSTIRIRLENEYQQSIELSVRGLTGVVTLGRVESGEGRSP